MNKHPEKAEEPSKGGRNLCLLGIIAAVIAIGTTTVSLFVYRQSGAIYLDRSRPGFISETEKEEQEKDATIFDVFPENGEIKEKDLDAYLEQLDALNTRLKASDNFDPSQLDDENIGIYLENEETEEEAIEASPESAE